MKILVKNVAGKKFSVECEPTDTIAHLKIKLGNINAHLMFDGKLLGDNFSENMTLADAGVQDGSLILDSSAELSVERPRRRHENDYLSYADIEFKFGWREEHAKALLELLLLEFRKDGTISEGNVADEAWLRIQNSLKNSMKCTFQIDFLKDRLRDYKNLYSVLTETNETSSLIFNWDRERKIVAIMEDDWNEEYTPLLCLCGPYIPYFDILEKVCKRVSESSTNTNNAQEASSSRGGPTPINSNLSSMGFSTIRSALSIDHEAQT